MFTGLSDIFQYIRSYYYSVFKCWYFVAIGVMLSAILYVNYYRPFTAPENNFLHNFLSDYFLYFFPFAAAYLLQKMFYKKQYYFKSKWFWALLLIAPAFFALRVNFNFHQVLIEKIGQADLHQYWLSVSNLLVRVFVLLLPVGIIWWIKDRDKEPFYGNSPIKNVRTFFVLLAMMLPLIILASYQPAFIKKYPIVLNAVGMDMPLKNMAYLFYEACYALDFIGIEFFFRGFLILAFSRICGIHAMVPAACFYCCIHLNKPMAEAISSFFGALLLGIISYNTKSIWGGVLIHIGIAWLMEFFAMLQRIA